MSDKPVMDVCREYWAEHRPESFSNRAAYKVVELEREHGDGTHEIKKDIRRKIISGFQEWVDTYD